MFSKFKTGKRNCSPQKFLESLVALTLVCLITMGAVYDASVKQITVIKSDVFQDSYESKTLRTRQNDVEAFLKENDIELSGAQQLSVPLDKELENADILEIKQGKNVRLISGGEETSILATEKNVGAILEDAGITLGANDFTEPAVNESISDDQQIVIHRVTEWQSVSYETIPSPNVIVEDENLYTDEKKISWGKDGKRELTYRVLCEGEHEFSRELVSDVIVEEAEDTVVRVGTKTRPTVVTASGQTLTYSRKIQVTATAYDTSPGENGGYSRTALGLKPGYGIVAVDPRVIPLGTKLYIESPDGGASWSYGVCIAGDTGGAIKGNRIDLCYNTQGECIQFGRRSATVYVLD